MDKKTLPLVIALVVVIVFYQQILQFFGLTQPTPVQPAPIDSVAIVQTNPTPTSTPVVTPGQIETSEPAGAIDSVVLDSTIIPDTVFITTNKYVVAMTTTGGGPVSMILRDYTLRDGTPIDMLINGDQATPSASFAGGTFSTSSIPFTCDLQPGHYDASSSPVEITYTYMPARGGEMTKRYRFYPDRYHFDLVLEMRDPETAGFERQYDLVWNTPLGITEPQLSADYEAMQVVAMYGGSRETLDDYENGILRQSKDGYTTWAGVRQKYFAAIMIPQNREAQGVMARGNKFNIPTPDGSVEKKELTVGIRMPFVGSFVDSFQVYVGPMDYMHMGDYNVGLEEILDIGTTPVIGWLIKPFAIGIMWVLPRMYDYIPNYGLVIIFFALFVKIITMPLSAKSFKSMQATRDLQPQIDELKIKHKKNAQALQQETMKLYKKSGVNPISGCLPMLPQMPLFFALFSVFRATILLRDAPFFWFFTDLSRGASSFTDPYMLLVVVMVVAQYASQKLTMPSAGGGQAKMFAYIMPLFMGFIFYKFAAGLVLYWTCFSIFSLLDWVAFKRKSNATNTHVKKA